MKKIINDYCISGAVIKERMMSQYNLIFKLLLCYKKSKFLSLHGRNLIVICCYTCMDSISSKVLVSVVNSYVADDNLNIK